MLQVNQVLPARRSTLRVHRSGRAGHRVVKNVSSGEYFALGEQESFLLESLDGSQTSQSLRSAYEQRFEQPLTDDDLNEFLDLARSCDLLERPGQSQREAGQVDAGDRQPRAEAAARSRRRARRSILYWYISLFDPDRLLSILEPRVRFLWARWFITITSMAIVLALIVSWSSRVELVTRFSQAFDWKLIALAWLTLVMVTACHEFAHGLTCKHYGGEVREIGFLMLFFTPCFYCNVSDTWLFREKSRRLGVTFAGAYCDLVLWAGAVLIWRLTMQDTLVNYLAWLVLSVCGVRIFFNLNPLLKLDGYYLLSDLLEFPNLRQRAWSTFTAQVRRVLWGAPRPAPQPHQTFLLAFGIASWLYSLAFLSVMLFAFISYLGVRMGLVGFAAALTLSILVMRGMLTGFCSGEVRHMIRFRPVRTAAWLLVLGGAAAALCFVEVNHSPGGQFLLRPSVCAELQAPLDGFLRELEVDEGDHVVEGQVIGRIEVRDLDTHILQKRNDIAEAAAKLDECTMELECANDDLARAEQMLAGNVMTVIEHRDAGRHQRACQARLEQAQARLGRLNEELAYLEGLTGRTIIRSPIAGVIVTPLLRQKKGLIFEEGDTICTVEDPARLEAEITLAEHDVQPVRVGQAVELKARALPFQTFAGVVDRIAPSAVPGELHSTLTVYCRLDADSDELQPGLTGHARVICGRRTLGRALLDNGLTLVRTEFWW